MRIDRFFKLLSLCLLALVFGSCTAAIAFAATPGHVLAAGFPVPGFLKSQLLSWAIAAVPTGAIVFMLGQWAKRESDWVASLGDWQKRGAIYAGAVLLVAIGHALGIDTHCDPNAGTDCVAALNQPVLEALVKAALTLVTAHILHAGKGGDPS